MAYFRSKSNTKFFLAAYAYSLCTIGALPTKPCNSSNHIQMAMKLSIVPDKRAYWPGDVVGLVVEVGWLHSQAFPQYRVTHFTAWKSSAHCS